MRWNDIGIVGLFAAALTATPVLACQDSTGGPERRAAEARQARQSADVVVLGMWTPRECIEVQPRQPHRCTGHLAISDAERGSLNGEIEIEFLYGSLKFCSFDLEGDVFRGRFFLTEDASSKTWKLVEYDVIETLRSGWEEYLRENGIE